MKIPKADSKSIPHRITDLLYDVNNFEIVLALTVRSIR